jgi:hypothetical protein
VESHDHAIRLKAEIMVDHFHEQVLAAGKIGGQARAMVVTSGIERAIQYFHAADRLKRIFAVSKGNLQIIAIAFAARIVSANIGPSSSFCANPQIIGAFRKVRPLPSTEFQCCFVEIILVLMT